MEKSRIAKALLLKVDGVAGVGTGKEGVLILITSDSDTIRYQVREALELEFGDVPTIEFMVTGKFEAL